MAEEGLSGLCLVHRLFELVAVEHWLWMVRRGGIEALGLLDFAIRGSLLIVRQQVLTGVERLVSHRGFGPAIRTVETSLNPNWLRLIVGVG